MLDLVVRFTVISPRRNDFSLMGFQKDSYNAIERLRIKGDKTKAKAIPLANHSKRKQRQSHQGENTSDQENLNTEERFAIFQINDYV